MGKLIMCAGKIAEKPYEFKSSGVRIYSMEELCYYIYHNVDTITEELFHKELIVFIKEQLGLAERASFLENLIEKKAGVKDIVVSIFCSADYYSEEEIKQLLAQIDLLYSLNSAQRKKRHADYCFQREQYKVAMREYRHLLTSKESQKLTPIEYGDVLHNIAVLEARSGAFLLAADRFLEAYERNERTESLKQYLYALKLGKQEVLFEREMKRMVENQMIYEDMKKELYHVVETEEYTASYQGVIKLQELKEQGKMQEYYLLVDHILEDLKQKYRLESI